MSDLTEFTRIEQFYFFVIYKAKTKLGNDNLNFGVQVKKTMERMCLKV